MITPAFHAFSPFEHRLHNHCPTPATPASRWPSLVCCKLLCHAARAQACPAWCRVRPGQAQAGGYCLTLLPGLQCRACQLTHAPKQQGRHAFAFNFLRTTLQTTLMMRLFVPVFVKQPDNYLPLLCDPDRDGLRLIKPRHSKESCCALTRGRPGKQPLLLLCYGGRPCAHVLLPCIAFEKFKARLAVTVQRVCCNRDALTQSA
jgi:hypothetical protein